MKQLLKLAAIAVVGTVALAAPSFAALKVGTQAPDFSAPAYLAGKPFTFKLADALKKGELRTVLDNYSAPPLALYAVYPPTRHLSVKVRLFIDFLVERFGREEEAASGRPK